MDLGKALIDFMEQAEWSVLRNPELKPKDATSEKIYAGVSIDEWIADEPDLQSGNITISVNADIGIENSDYHGRESSYDDHEVIIIISSFDQSNLKLYTELTKNLLNLYYGDDIGDVYIMNSVLTNHIYRKNADKDAAFSTLVFQMRKRI